MPHCLLYAIPLLANHNNFLHRKNNQYICVNKAKKEISLLNYSKSKWIHVFQVATVTLQHGHVFKPKQNNTDQQLPFWHSLKTHIVVSSIEFNIPPCVSSRASEFFQLVFVLKLWNVNLFSSESRCNEKSCVYYTSLIVTHHFNCYICYACMSVSLAPSNNI